MTEAGVIPRPEEREHAGCRQRLLSTWARACAEVGSGPPDEITVSTEPPLLAGQYAEGFTCPHGVTFWIEPTGDQIARWREEGIS